MNKDLTNVYKIDETKGLVKYTVKANGNYYTGHAKCNFEDGDKFDLEKGKRIAKLRAVKKMKQAQLKEAMALQYHIRILLAVQEDIENDIQKYTQSLVSIEDKLATELGIELPEPEPVEMKNA